MSTPRLPLTLTPAPGTSGPVLYLNPYTGSYTESRSYALRMQRNYARGIPQSVARGQRARPGEEGLSEFERRRLRFLERYGFSEAIWRRLYRKYIREINEMSSPSAQITRQMIRVVLDNGDTTGLDIEWLDNRLREKLEDMQDYRANNKQKGPERTGYGHFWADQSLRLITFAPIEFWWYH